MQQTLLVELLTEELPPKSLRVLSEAFADAVAAGLREQGFAGAHSTVTPYATPRRLAVSVTDVAGVQPERKIERKGPALASAFDAAGKPTAALAGFAKSCGVAVEALERARDAKSEYLVFRSTRPGEALDTHLAPIVQAALKKLPIPKMMRWGDSDVQFVRPAHSLILLHGARVVPGVVLGLDSGNVTRGHRFQARQASFAITDAEAYEATLRDLGGVVASFAARRASIERSLLEHARSLGASLSDYQALLDEVTALVERPSVYLGEFEADFLTVPQECLILTMRQNQKYFPLLDSAGRLLPKFLIVSNMQLDDPGNIVRGNQRVVRPRLDDARFFFTQDRKTRLEQRVPLLANVVYHNKIGTQLERTERVQLLAGSIARQSGSDPALAERAAWLAKADLLTGMVGEFPELQGTMGRYYAQHDGEPEAVATAIEAHYRPRFANDALPQTGVATAVALADKLDALVGIYGIGLVPTGDKDPFALRRQGLGILRMLIEHGLGLDLRALLEQARAGFSAGLITQNTDAMLGFMFDRLRGYLRERGFNPNEIESVVSQAPVRVDLVLPRLNAVREFCKLPEAAALAAANKRIGNILTKSHLSGDRVDPRLLQEPEEKALHGKLLELGGGVQSLVAQGRYEEALKSLATLREPVDAFFDKVLVNADDPALRANRHGLLHQLSMLMNQVADISRLAG